MSIQLRESLQKTLGKVQEILDSSDLLRFQVFLSHQHLHTMSYSLVNMATKSRLRESHQEKTSIGFSEVSKIRFGNHSQHESMDLKMEVHGPHFWRNPHFL